MRNSEGASGRGRSLGWATVGVQEGAFAVAFEISELADINQTRPKSHRARLSGVPVLAGTLGGGLRPMRADGPEVDGNGATGSSYLEAKTVSKGTAYRVAGRYRDQYRRTPEGWRFARMEFERCSRCPSTSPGRPEDRLKAASERFSRPPWRAS